jgi:hypothetical protein
MKNILGIFLLLCLNAAAATPNGKPSDCSPRQLASTEITVGENILVPVEYHGQRLWMVLDLGEPFSLLRPSATEALHLHTATLDDRPDGFKLLIGGKRVTATAAVDSLKIGSYRISRRDFFVDPRAHPSESPADQTLLGTLGMGELWPVDFELDLTHRRFNLYSPGHCPKAPVYWSDHYSRVPMQLNEFGNVYFALELDGSKIEAGISTTDLETYMSTDVSRQVFGFDEHSPGVEVQIDAKGESHAYFRAMTLTSGDLRLSDVLIRLAPAVKSCTLSKTAIFGDVPEFKGRDDHLCFGAYPLVLGRRAIEQLRLYFATTERTIYFTAAE